MKQSKYLLGVAIMSVCGILVAGCSSTPGSSSPGDSDGLGSVASDCEPAHDTVDTKTEGVLTVTGSTLMPFASITPDSLEGVEGDVLKRIAEMECLEITLAPVSAAAAISTVQTGRADVAIGDWNRRADRLELVDMSDPTFLDQMGLISETGESDVTAVSGDVGSVTGYGWNPDLEAIYGERLKLYPSNVQMYADLELGRISAAIDGYGPGIYSAPDTFTVVVVDPTEKVGASLTPAPQSAFVLPKSGALTAVFNDNLATLKESGEFAEILAKYDLPAEIGDTGEPRAIE